MQYQHHKAMVSQGLQRRPKARVSQWPRICDSPDLRLAAGAHSRWCDLQWSGLRCCAGGFLAVRSCPNSAAECASAVTDRVSRRTGADACGERDGTEVQCDDSDGRRRVARAFFCWCNSDNAVLGAGYGCFSLRYGVMTFQLLSTSIFDLS